MFIYESRYLTRAEVWYDDAPDDTGRVDWILYCRRSKPVPSEKVRTVHTYFIDLNRSHDQLLANLNKDTAYKIRRARERDKVVCEVCNPCDPAVMDRYEEMYNQFAKMKGLFPLQRPRMESMATAGVLDLSAVRDVEGNVLVYHANYRDRHRATSMELPSLYRKLADSAARNFIGRASRYLTWTDILRYQERGLRFFDFGGWYQGSNPEMLKINDFKKGFGGQVMCEFECEQTLTCKGRVVLAVAAALDRLKAVFSPVSQPASGSQMSERATPDAVAGRAETSPNVDESA